MCAGKISPSRNELVDIILANPIFVIIKLELKLKPFSRMETGLPFKPFKKKEPTFGAGSYSLFEGGYRVDFEQTTKMDFMNGYYGARWSVTAKKFRIHFIEPLP
jgi:hypothetical protein